jgi:O-succinylbenzoate synthase
MIAANEDQDTNIANLADEFNLTYNECCERLRGIKQKLSLKGSMCEVAQLVHQFTSNGLDGVFRTAIEESWGAKPSLAEYLSRLAAQDAAGKPNAAGG